MSFKDGYTFSSCVKFVRRNGTVCENLVEGIWDSFL